MKTLPSKLLATLGALSVGMSMAVNVQALDKPSTYPSVAQGAPAPNAAPKTSEMTMGEIQKVDKGTNQLTIKHGGIKSLDLPSATILFTVRDPAVLDSVQTGDKVKFKAMSEGGKVVVTEFEILK